MSRLLALVAALCVASQASAQFPPAAQFQAAIDEYVGMVQRVAANTVDPLVGYVALQAAANKMYLAGTASGKWPHSDNVAEYDTYVKSSRWTVYDLANKGMHNPKTRAEQFDYWLQRVIAKMSTPAEANAAMAPQLQAAVTQIRAIAWD